MAFTTQSMNTSKKEEAPTGELRLDAEGKGYWHKFKKVEEVKVEEVKVEEVKEVQAPRRRRK